MEDAKNDKYWMQQAILLAKKAENIGEIPVGAIIVFKNTIIGKGYNQTENTNNVLAHAEIMAICEASKKLKNWRLSACSIFVTLEPCIMCKGAIINSRIQNLIYATPRNKNSLKQSIKITKGILAKESNYLLKTFFKKLRD